MIQYTPYPTKTVNAKKITIKIISRVPGMLNRRGCVPVKSVSTNRCMVMTGKGLSGQDTDKCLPDVYLLLFPFSCFSRLTAFIMERRVAGGQINRSAA
jgi:hypothetical protein